MLKDTMKDLEEARREISEIDRQMADLFQRRMEAVARVAAYKKEKGLPILDEDQELRVLERGIACLSDEGLKPYYIELMKKMMSVSKDYQEQLISDKGIQ